MMHWTVFGLHFSAGLVCSSLRSFESGATFSLGDRESAEAETAKPKERRKEGGHEQCYQTWRNFYKLANSTLFSDFQKCSGYWRQMAKLNGERTSVHKICQNGLILLEQKGFF